MRKQKVIAIVGPTASGKTSLGIFLAQKFRGEIISADSRQIYRGLDIGTGKVTKHEMAGIPHHMLDIASPRCAYSAGDFQKDAERVLSQISVNNKIPIVVGGTGFYIDVLLGRMVLPDVPPNPALRARLEKLSTEELYTMLKKKDPRRARTIERAHKRRIVRALEIATMIGRSPKPKSRIEYDVLWIGLALSEKRLHANIRKRLNIRLKRGMVAEAKRLHAHGLSYRRMYELGLEYRLLAQFLQKKITLEEMRDKLERAIYEYARRQMRWFRRNSDIHWVKNKSDALRLTKRFL